MLIGIINSIKQTFNVL